MSDSLKNQLLGLGFEPKQPRRNKSARKRKDKRPQSSDRGEMSLAQAFRQRHEAEQQKKEAEREQQLQREKANRKLDKLVAKHALNQEEADVVRHFQWHDKIRRTYVTEQQNQQLADEEIGLISLRGRYYLLSNELVEAVRSIKPDAVILPAVSSD